jgi:hypothetical protein
MFKRLFDPTLYAQAWFRDTDDQEWVEGFYLYSAEGLLYPHNCAHINGSVGAFKQIAFENPIKRNPFILQFDNLSDFDHVWCRDKHDAPHFWREGYYIAHCPTQQKHLVAVNNTALVFFEEISYPKPEGIE